MKRCRLLARHCVTDDFPLNFIRVCGVLENAAGFRPSGFTIAVSECRLHHLPFSKLEELETTHPDLVIKLYKLMSYLMARKEEITIDHLSTLHAIMSAPAHSKPLSRDALRAFALIQ